MYVNDGAGSFVGREVALGQLNQHLAAVVSTGHGRLVAVQGRRQIGKSTLVERFVEAGGLPYLFFTGLRGASQQQQLLNAQRAVGESKRPWAEAELLSQPASSWQDWWSRLAVAARQGPAVVVMDEFPWLTGGDVAIESALQVVWDRQLEQLPVLMVIVGSDVAMMERLQEHDRPLFGRLRSLVLGPLNPAEIASAAPQLAAREVFDAYLVTGGYPRLVTDLARTDGSVDDYVVAELADPYSPLVATARFT
ncbi:MAG: ATP-binding protein, partial [Propionibacteriaceae bacterium]|nr:ATP-binding protein [Propionibacteriaceae bacterium]